MTSRDAYLRKLADAPRLRGFTPSSKHLITAGADAERRQIVEWLTDFAPSFADAIERGDHWKDEQ